MSRIPNPVIDRVREQTDIVDVISRHVSLQRSGRRYKGLCPFHDEKTPSFHVDRERQLFYCFGCQTGGDVFTFLMRIENADFPEVLRQLADAAGIPIESVEPSPEAVRRRREWEALAAAAEKAALFYQQKLGEAQGALARAFLRDRGISSKPIEQYRLGYAPHGWRNLYHHLRTQGIAQDIGLKAGLLGQGRRGVYDRLRHRLIFPIADVRGNVVGFGGRALGDDVVKYLNSPESTLYVKREHLYGLHELVAEKKSYDRIVLVEGYMDVISLVSHGFSPVVASLGTALTPEQARLLKRYTDEVVLAYDADQAGQAATMRGLDVLQSENLNVKVINMPAGHDPDSCVREMGLDGWLGLVEEAVPLYEYKITRALDGIDLGGLEGQIAGTQKVVPILAEITSAVAKEGYTAHAASLLGVSFEALAKEITFYEASQGKAKTVRHNLSTGRYTSIDSAQRERTVRRAGRQAQGRSRDGQRQSQGLGPSTATGLLAWLLREPHRIKEAYERLGEQPFAGQNENKLFQWLFSQGEGEATGEAFIDRIDDPQLAQFAGSLLNERDKPMAPFDVYLRRAQKEALKAEVDRVEARLELLMRDEWISKPEIDGLLMHLKGLRGALPKIAQEEDAS